MILAGDSLNRNMWESLACLLHSSVDPSTVELHDNSSISNSTLFWKSKVQIIIIIELLNYSICI
ncbi:Protein trichome birefringence-like 41 [Bienertia sinuspersici]